LILREAEATPIVVEILDGIAIGGADEEGLSEGVVAVLGDERVGRMALAVGAGDDSFGRDSPDEVAGAEDRIRRATVSRQVSTREVSTCVGELR
jgi:hypothetical protein